MRGLGQTISRLPAATALLAGVALLGHGAAHADAPADERAMLVPRLVPPGSSSGPDLPTPLAADQAERIRHIFRLQARGAIADAVRETEQVDVSTVLGEAIVGHLLADRYLGPYTHPHAEELQAWLARHGELPDAPDIHDLLTLRLPRGAKPPPRPQLSALSAQPTDQPPVPEESGPADHLASRNPALDRDVGAAARQRGEAGVLRLLRHTAGLSPSYASVLKGEAARVLFTLGRDEEALSLGSAGARACGRDPECATSAQAGYTAGLAAWRLGRPGEARPLFEAAWRAKLGTPSLRAAAAFWAARAHLLTRDTGNAWLGRAAVERYTFYGQVARRILGRGGGGGDRGGRELLGAADLEAVAATPQGLRAFALLQLGQRERAEAELRLLWPEAEGQPALARAIMLVADRAGLAELAAQLADLLQAADGRPRETTRFRVPRLRPDGGFIVDPALVYAIARTESNFNAKLVSSAGARGIMQIMPETATFLVASHGPRIERMLNDPAISLDLGQKYVAYLATHPTVENDLLRLLASYNAGPGSVTKWAPGVRDLGDPFLFIESIPLDETRAFVPRVLSYTWIFAERLRLPTPSLDALARGAWPGYVPHEQQQAEQERIRPLLH